MLRTRQMIVALGVLLSLGWGCRQLSPLEELERIRSSYTAELSSFSVRQQPVAGEESEAETEGVEPEADAEDVAAGEATEEMEPAVTSDLMLDILIGTESDETIDGLTIDFELVDANEQLKERRLLYVDTSQVMKGSAIQTTVVVEDVDYVEGDKLTAAVRSPVPPAERGSYREFADLPAS